MVTKTVAAVANGEGAHNSRRAGVVHGTVLMDRHTRFKWVLLPLSLSPGAAATASATRPSFSFRTGTQDWQVRVVHMVTAACKCALLRLRSGNTGWWLRAGFLRVAQSLSVAELPTHRVAAVHVSIKRKYA